MRRWSLLLCSVGLAACSRPPSGMNVAAGDAAPAVSMTNVDAAPSAVSERAPPPPISATDLAALPEALAPGMTCESSAPSGLSHTPPRACLVKGRIVSVHEDRVPNPAASGPVVAGTTPTYVRGIVVELGPAPADTVCSTPLAPGAKEPVSTWSDRMVATRITLLGAGRVLPLLVPGRTACGWVHDAYEPGLPAGRRGAEVALRVDGELLLAASPYLQQSARAPRMIAAGFSFAREGTPTRQKLDEGGEFVTHPFVRVSNGGKSVRTDGREETLVLPGGTRYAVRATSQLTEGRTPVFTGNWDGYAFSVVRIP